MSILNVNKINPVGGGSTVTIAGIASVTNNISVGNSVTASSFHGDGSQLTGISPGVSLSNGADNRVITATSASAITGESNLTFDGTNLTAATGNVVIGTAAKGIDYSAQTASSLSGVTVTSELLDHYEEGTFTPTFGASNGTSTAGYSTQSGKYTRIGNLVHVQIRITLSSLVTNVHSHAWISGLPIASAERTATSSIVCGGLQGTGFDRFAVAGRTEAGATRIELFTPTNGGVTDLSTGIVSGTAYFILSCTYIAA